MFRKSNITFIVALLVLLLFFSGCRNTNEDMVVFYDLPAFSSREVMQTFHAARDAKEPGFGWFEERIESEGGGIVAFSIDEEDADPFLKLQMELMQSGEFFVLSRETTIRILKVYESEPMYRSHVRGYVVDGRRHVGEEFWTDLGSIEFSIPPDAEWLPDTYPFGFDLYDPEGWSGGGEWSRHQQNQWSWMDEQGLLLAQDDLAIGNFRLGMTLEEAREYIPAEDVREFLDETQKTIMFGFLGLLFSEGDNDSFILEWLSIHGSEHATPRGLRVGDSAETLYELYGIPHLVGRDEWRYDYIVWNEENGRFQVRFPLEYLGVFVVDGIVEEIRIDGRR